MKNTQKLKYDKDEVKEMLRHSNFIEGVTIAYAHVDAMKAWKYIAIVPQLSIASILRVHELLLERISPSIAGKFRRCDVWIGGSRKRYQGLEVLELKLEKWVQDVTLSISSKTGNQDKVSKKHHVKFEDIHPFVDGNGRVGRILYNWHRLKLGLSIHIVHEGKEQSAYYSWFE